jgi:hypothetical protein
LALTAVSVAGQCQQQWQGRGKAELVNNCDEGGSFRVTAMQQQRVSHDHGLIPSAPLPLESSVHSSWEVKAAACPPAFISAQAPIACTRLPPLIWMPRQCNTIVDCGVTDARHRLVSTCRRRPALSALTALAVVLVTLALLRCITRRSPNPDSSPCFRVNLRDPDIDSHNQCLK